MKNFLITLVFISICSCSSDCEDVRTGSIDPPMEYFDYAVYEAGETVNFENENGELVSLIVDTTRWEGRVLDREIGVNTDFQNGDQPCYEYRSTLWLITQLISEDDLTNLEVTVIPFNQKEEDLEYVAEIKSSWAVEDSSGLQTGFVQAFYNITQDRFTPELGSGGVDFERLMTWEANGQSFDDVMKFKSNEAEIYFVKEKGIVGFSRLGAEIFTLME